MKTGRDGILYDIIMWKGSMFNKQIEEIKSELELGKGWDYISIGKWKEVVQRGIDKKRLTDIKSITFKPKQLEFNKIKSQCEINKDIMGVKGERGRMIMRMRAQTLDLSSDYHNMGRYNEICKCCKKKENDFEHVIFKCEGMKEERQKLVNDIAKRLDDKDVEKLEERSNGEIIQSILGLYVTTNKEKNIEIIEDLSEYMISYDNK